MEDIPFFHLIAISSHRDQYFGHSDLAKIENLRVVRKIIAKTLAAAEWKKEKNKIDDVGCLVTFTFFLPDCFIGDEGIC